VNLLAELKRRNVIRVGVAWLALSWLLVAMSALLFPALGLPIVAVRWMIYGLAAAWIPAMLLAWRYELSPYGFRVDQGPGGDNPQNAITGQRLDQMTVVVILAALSLALIRQFIDEHGPKPDSTPAAPIVAPAPAPAPPPRPPGPVDPHSIALLPFTNMSPDADDAYFADGLTEELINVLARIPGLKVTSRSSSFLFRETRLDVREIAARLGVANLVEGSVRRQGEKVRVTVQLISADGGHLWSGAYDRRLVDIFRVQEEISQSIADALADTLGVRKVKVAPATADLEAYEWYLRGRQLFAQRGANLPAARGLLERAVERDPDFADAWTALAGTWYVWRSYAAEPAGAPTLVHAGEAAARALALDPQHPGALAVSARLAADRGDRRREAELIRTALALEPNNANTWLWQGLGRFEVGHIKEAHASFVQAQRLDPLSGLHLGWLGISTAMHGDRARAQALLKQAHALGWRGPASRALFLLALDDGSDVTQRYLDWLHDDDGLLPAQRDLARTLAPALGDEGQRAQAQQALIEAAAESPDLRWVALLQVFGATDAAVQMSLSADAAGLQSLILTLWYPQFRSFRQHPDFLAFAERQGLPAYWHAHGLPDGCSLEMEPVAHLQCAR
jgi:TolB-like protein/Tfp pilus assembly protein PilF